MQYLLKPELLSKALMLKMTEEKDPVSCVSSVCKSYVGASILALGTQKGSVRVASVSGVTAFNRNNIFLSSCGLFSEAICHVQPNYLGTALLAATQNQVMLSPIRLIDEAVTSKKDVRLQLYSSGSPDHQTPTCLAWSYPEMYPLVGYRESSQIVQFDANTVLI